MFVFVGAKHHGYRKVGYVADFCPLCRCPTVFEVLRIGVSRQTIKMYEEAGKKHLITHKRVCQDCGTEMAAQMTMYRTVAAAPAGLPTLMACTFPNLAAVHHARLALEERIRDSPGSLSTHQRLALVRESVGLLAPSVDRFYQPSFQGATWLIAGSIAYPLILIQEPKLRVLGMCCLLLFASVFALRLWRVRSSRQRFLKERVIPLLIERFRSFQPTRSEIQIVLGEMKCHHQKIGLLLRPEDVT